jgi:hypothetical protein
VTEKTPRLQLWKEEAAVLAAFAAAVPPGGTIVEIGTAEGATARLMRDAAKPGVEIYTVDVAPSQIARASLAGRQVTVVARASEMFAGEWPEQVGRPIDFLFIDGNHDLLHVVGDWNLWTRHLRPGATVAFHDFDPPRRGGLAHFAVRICGETVRRTGRLGNAAHDYKMLHGQVVHPDRASIGDDECRETLVSIADQVDEVLSGRAVIATAGDARLAALLRLALGERARISEDGIAIDSLTLCYLAEQALRDYAGIAELPSSHTEFLAWGEALQMLDHGWPGPRFPHQVPAAGVTLAELSAFIAREQVRLTLLSRMTALLVEGPL